MEDVAEWLSGAGVMLFFADSSYAVVKTSVVESWPRITSKRLSADVRAVAQGTFDFATLEPLLSKLAQPAPRMPRDALRSVATVRAIHLWDGQDKSA